MDLQKLPESFQIDGTENGNILTRNARFGLSLLFVLAAVAGPVVNIVDPSLMQVFVPMLVFMILVLSLDFVFGYCGMPSFAHASMFGAGGYAVAFLLLEYSQSLVLGLALAAVVGAVVALFIGALSVRATGLYFAFLTLAFAEMFRVIVFQDIPATVLGADRISNGSNGLVGIPTFQIPFVNLFDQLMYYYLVLAVLILLTVFTVRLANSPFGTVMRGISENQERMEALGYPVNRYKIVAFTISGAIAGIAGALYVPFLSIASPNILAWMMSGELIIMSLIGGLGTLWGPMIAAAGITYTEFALTSVEGWPIIMGALYVIVILVAPKGLAGLVGKFRDWVTGDRSIAIPKQLLETIKNLR